MSLVSFTIILWQLSGPLALLGVEIPRAMTFVAYLFVIVATVIAFRIGHPLIRLNFLRELFRASFRYALVRLAGQLGGHRLPPGRADRAGHAVDAVLRCHRQRLGHRLPEPEVPGSTSR